MDGITTLILIAGGMLLIVGLITMLGRRYDLNSISDRTVGHGQHGTARWATEHEIRRTYQHIPFTPDTWRKEAQKGLKPTVDGKPLSQGIVVGCKGRTTTTAIVDTDDVHVLMIGASGVGKTAYFLYPNLEYACASGMSFLALDTKGDLARNYGAIARDLYGYRISVVDLREPTKSDGNNLLTLINRYMDQYRDDSDDLGAKAKAEKYAKILAKTIVNPDGSGTDRGQNAYFYDAAEGLLSAVVLLLAEFLPPEETDGIEVRHISSVFKLVQELLEDSGGHGRKQFHNLMDRFLPAAGMVSSNDDKQRAGSAEIYVQDLARQMVYASERVGNNPKLYRMLPVGEDELAPTIELYGKKYQINGIDILESYAKYQEAVLAFLVENRQFAEIIDPEKLRPEYYSAFSYFIDKVGSERIFEFPVACELALSASRPCFIDQQGKWKEHYPAWRYIRIIDVISRYEQGEYLTVSNLEANFASYVDKTLRNCGYMGWDDCWDSVVKYAEQTGMNISNDMVRAIEFKREYPWALSFPFINSEVYGLMKEFHPYYYVMADSSGYAVDSESLGQEVVFENHFQAFAHQICGHISPRCMDCGKVQCGFSYYGIKGCQYLLDGSCDGHVDRDSELPRIVLDENRNIVEGCLFEAFLNVMGVEVKDLVVTDISKRIDPDMFKKIN